MGRGDRRMAGQWYLADRHEIADAEISLIGRKDERRLGEIEFPGDRLHLRTFEAARIDEHGASIAGKRRCRERIDPNDVVSGYSCRSPSSEKRLAAL